MQELPARIIKLRFRHWVFTFRTILIMFIFALVCCLHFFDLQININEANILKSNEFDSIPTIRVYEFPAEELPKLSKENQLEILANTTQTIEDKNVTEILTLYNVYLKLIVEEINNKQTIRNFDKYGPLTNDSSIVVIQVHNRVQYLRATIDSLSEARDIEDAILIFSHDYYDTEINDLIREIDFCKTMQIFFPYSSQIYTNMFPGPSQNDCPPNITQDKAIKMNYIEAKNHDHNGACRNSTITQIKHHWWWKVNTVFDQLQVLRDYTSLIVFIEDDHYVAEDFIHTLKVMQRTCPRCKIFSLGANQKYIYSSKPKMTVSLWMDSLGMSFNRSVWNELLQCAEIFCHYDDYNWDWTLRKIAKICDNHSFLAATLRNSRVIHIGQCGVHHFDNCTDMSHVIELKQDLTSLNLYPDKIDVIYQEYHHKMDIGWGGWADPRDHKLCMSMIHHDINT